MKSTIEKEIYRQDYPKMWRHQKDKTKRIVLELENRFIIWSDADNTLLGKEIKGFDYSSHIELKSTTITYDF